jgi:hypothetical protein
MGGFFSIASWNDVDAENTTIPMANTKPVSGGGRKRETRKKRRVSLRVVRPK